MSLGVAISLAIFIYEGRKYQLVIFPDKENQGYQQNFVKSQFFNSIPQNKINLFNLPGIQDYSLFKNNFHNQGEYEISIAHGNQQNKIKNIVEWLSYRNLGITNLEQVQYGYFIHFQGQKSAGTSFYLKQLNNDLYEQGIPCMYLSLQGKQAIESIEDLEIVLGIPDAKIIEKFIEQSNLQKHIPFIIFDDIPDLRSLDKIIEYLAQIYQKYEIKIIVSSHIHQDSRYQSYYYQFIQSKQFIGLSQNEMMLYLQNYILTNQKALKIEMFKNVDIDWQDIHLIFQCLKNQKEDCQQLPLILKNQGDSIKQIIKDRNQSNRQVSNSTDSIDYQGYPVSQLIKDNQELQQIIQLTSQNLISLKNGFIIGSQINH